MKKRNWILAVLFTLTVSGLLFSQAVTPGGGSSSGGDATAANQSLIITAVNAVTTAVADMTTRSIQIVDGASDAIIGTVFDYANSNPQAVRLVDGSGDAYNVVNPTVVTEGSGFPQTTGAELTAIGVRECDTPASPVTTAQLTALCAKDGYLYIRGFLTDASGTALTFASEAATPVISLDVDENKLELSDGSGCIAGLFVGNRDTTPVFVKLWTVDSDSVTVGTTAPNMIFQVGSSGTDGVSGNVIPAGLCIPFTTGLTIAAVTSQATSGSTGPGTNEVVTTAWLK